ncbi:hypothetical protein RCL1_007434 [Eukaryota sp. TZLM3-RCL]
MSSHQTILELSSAFPTVELEIISTLLQQCNGDPNLTSLALLSISDPEHATDFSLGRPDEQHQISRDEALARSLQREYLDESSSSFNVSRGNPISTEVRSQLPGTSIAETLSNVGSSTVKAVKSVVQKLRNSSRYERLPEASENPIEANQEMMDLSITPGSLTRRRRNSDPEDEEFDRI